MSQRKVQETQQQPVEHLQKLRVLKQNGFQFFEIEKEETQNHPCRYMAAWKPSIFMISPGTDTSHLVPFSTGTLFAYWRPQSRARNLNQEMSGQNFALLVPTTTRIPGFLGLQQIILNHILKP